MCRKRRQCTQASTARARRRGASAQRPPRNPDFPASCSASASSKNGKSNCKLTHSCRAHHQPPIQSRCLRPPPRRMRMRTPKLRKNHRSLAPNTSDVAKRRRVSDAPFVTRGSRRGRWASARFIPLVLNHRPAARLQHLSRHRHIHDPYDKLPNPCPAGCGKRFSRSDHAKIHFRRAHGGELPASPNA